MCLCLWLSTCGSTSLIISLCVECLALDAANGVSFFPDPSVARLAVTSGQRHYDLPTDMHDDDDDDVDSDAPSRNASVSRNVLQVYEFPASAQATAAPETHSA